MEDFNFLRFLMHPKEESLGGAFRSDYLLGSNASTENADLVQSFVTCPSSIPNSLCGQGVRQPCLARVQTMGSDGYPTGMEIMRVRSQQHIYLNKAVHQQLYEVMPSFLMNQKTTHRVGGACGAHSVFRAEGSHNVQHTAIMSAQRNLDWERESSDLHEFLTLLPRVDPDQAPTTFPGTNWQDHEKQAQDRFPAPHRREDHKLDIAERLPYAGNLYVKSSSARHQSGLSDLLQDSSQQHPHTNLSLDVARFSDSAGPTLRALRYSKYLKPARELLVKFCNPGRDAVFPLRNIHNITSSPEAWNVQGSASCGWSIHQERDRKLPSSCKAADHQRGNSHPHSNQLHSPSPPTDPSAPKQLSVDEWRRLQTRKEGLIEMVEELDMRYEQYRLHMEQITASFESVTGPGVMAAAYTALARRSISRQFRGLRDAIEDHIHKVCKTLGEELSTSVPILNKGETPRLRILDQRLRHHRVLQQQQQVWRPQRGLPERSVSVLRAWLFEHFFHPYPNDSEKLMLARLACLTKIQVSNWFVNARVRLWKPMIEEMYAKESNTPESNEAAANVGSIDDAVSYKNIAPVRGGQGDEAMSLRQSYALGSAHVEHVGGAYSEIIPTITQSPQHYSNMAPMPVDKIALLTRYL